MSNSKISSSNLQHTLVTVPLLQKFWFQLVNFHLLFRRSFFHLFTACSLFSFHVLPLCISLLSSTPQVPISAKDFWRGKGKGKSSLLILCILLLLSTYSSDLGQLVHHYINHTHKIAEKVSLRRVVEECCS